MNATLSVKMCVGGGGGKYSILEGSSLSLFSCGFSYCQGVVLPPFLLLQLIPSLIVKLEFPAFILEREPAVFQESHRFEAQDLDDCRILPCGLDKYLSIDYTLVITPVLRLLLLRLSVSRTEYQVLRLRNDLAVVTIFKFAS